MKVLNISLDNKILDKNSSVAKRAIHYGNLLDEYFIVVPGKNKTLELSNNTKVISIEGDNKFLTLFKIYKYLDKHLKENKYDLITIQDSYYLASIGIDLANKFGIKSEIQVHGFEKLGFFRKTIAKSNLQKADKIRVVSQRLKNKIITEFSAKEKKIYIVPIAINKDKIIASKGELNLKEKYPNSFIFLTVSRLVPIKNIAMQIKALAKLKNKNTKLIIVGDGPEKNNLKNLSKELGIEDRVYFEGWIDNLADYYHSADCLLLSSNSEGYGVVVAEAVLAALPVIMTDVGVAGELIKDNINGLVVPVGDQNAFTKAMTRVIEDEALLQRCSTDILLFKNDILGKDELINEVVNKWKNISNA